MRMRSFLFGFLRDEADAGDAGGGGKPDPGAEAAALRKELADLKKRDSDAAKDKEKAAGEWNNVIKRYEADAAAEAARAAKAEKERDEALAQIAGFHKEKRSNSTAEDVAKALGVPADRKLRALMLATELDLAPDKLTPEHVKKIADEIRKIDPDLKPAGRAAGAAGSGPVGRDGAITDWTAFGRHLAGKDQLDKK